MKLSKIIERFEYTLISGNIDVEIGSLVYDSRKAEKGSLFVCITGANSDGHDYIGQVLEKGAAAVIVKSGRDVSRYAEEMKDTVFISTDDTRLALAFASAAWFDYPAEKIPVIGITGTKGKTTTTYMIKSILENAGIKTGLIGTIETDNGKDTIPSNNTTPESYLIHKYLREMIENGCESAVMEVSSQALMMHRTAGIMFEIGVFTNISPDHIGDNEHKDFEDYLNCKSMLFLQCRYGIFNADDEKTEYIMSKALCECETFGISSKADLKAENICHIYRPGYLGMAYELKGKTEFRVELDIPGMFSVYNSLTAIAVCRHFNVPKDAILKALKAARVKGRIEIIKVSDDFTLMIDYAHNAMALESLLTTLRDYEPRRIVCLFGCGGNRAKSRRFEMGEVSGKLADLTIITSDNPRFEEPLDIIGDIKTGIEKTSGKYVEIPDRKEAIRYAIRNAEAGDVIILAGKGHEDYQEIKGKKYPMDERVIIREILEEDGI
ncbi:MAG: UDP-N-acetylmuramoyl-L-alanyl-D-glutamate--2,6-diaminopimelate ligase [Lachnospiraceae bacterium]